MTDTEVAKLNGAKLSGEILKVVFAFNSNDNRRDEIRAMANWASSIEWDLAALQSRLEKLERLYHAVHASPGPLTGDVAAAFNALRVQELGA